MALLGRSLANGSDGEQATMDRRGFLRNILAAGAGAGLSCVATLLGGCAKRDEPVATSTAPGVTSTPTRATGDHEARFYRRLADDAVQCELCWRRCVVRPGELGFCYNRKNVDGTYYSVVYGRAAALQIDPIEKEPAFHMLPGGTIFCTGTASCNNRCRFCQNWHLSQQTTWEVHHYDRTPDEIVAQAREGAAEAYVQRPDGSLGPFACDAVSFTYNEPTVFYEFMYDIAARAKDKGMWALLHTNGGMNREPMLELLGLMDAVTVDLKAFTDEFYSKVSSARLGPVLSTLETIRGAGKHLEIVNLVIPTLNDDLDDIRRMCAWIVTNLGGDVPLHFTRFFPAYKLQRLSPTPVETLEAAAQVADAEGVQYVYIGNTPGHRRNSTFCPGCGEMLISRMHFAVIEVSLDHGKCPACGQEIPGIWWD